MRIALLLLLLSCRIYAVPGDILFQDDFERTSLAPWTTTDTTRSGIGTHTSNSPTRSMYLNNNTVTVTSPVVNLAVDGAQLDVWIRRGDDSFSEDPDTGEDLILEYLDNNGVWREIDRYYGGGTDGEIILITDYQLPADALHANFQLRFTLVKGSRSIYWDFWHIDDVVITETGYAPPPPKLELGQCDDFEGDLSNWSITDTLHAGITTQTFHSPTHSLAIYGGYVEVTSVPSDTSTNAKEITVWIRRGDDSFSEDPDRNEDLLVEYYNNAGNWVLLERFTGNGTPGEIFERTYPFPADAQHPNFRLRFRLLSGSNNNDYWHVDDVCLVMDAYLTLQKQSCVLSDPVNGTVNPKRIPGATVRYALEVENITTADTDDVIVTDYLNSYFDTTTIRNIQIVAGSCDCTGAPSGSNNGPNGTTDGVNPVKLDFGSVAAQSTECGYFEVDLK